jgi:hypothetical protein
MRGQIGLPPRFGKLALAGALLYDFLYQVPRQRRFGALRTLPSWTFFW